MKKILFIFLMLMTSLCIAANPRLQKLTVILDHSPSPDHAPLIMAKELGFFKQQGLDVDIIRPSSSTDTVRWLMMNKADIALSYEPTFIQQVEKGLPLIRIGTLIDKPLNCLVVLKNSKIATLADLKGKRIGTNNKKLTSSTLKAMLAAHGINDKDVTYVTTYHELIKALLSHKIDAAIGVMRNVEVPMLEANGYQTVAFFPEENGGPNYSELIFIANKNHAHDARFHPFLAALKDAVIYLDQHPETSWHQFTRKYPEANNQVNKEIWFATLPYFAEDPESFDKKEWQHFTSFMAENNLINKVSLTSIKMAVNDERYYS